MAILETANEWAMTQAARLKTFRQRTNLTQEALAERWGTTVRTVSRWEQGKGRPAEWMQREMAAVEDPLLWPGAAMLRELIENRQGPAMIYNLDMKVLACSRPHNAWMHHVHGIDAVGTDWRRYMSPASLEMLESGGGLKYMTRHGLLGIRGTYHDPGGKSDTFIPPEMYLDLAIMRIPDYGTLCVCVAREPQADERMTPLQPYFLD